MKKKGHANNLGVKMVELRVGVKITKFSEKFEPFAKTIRRGLWKCPIHIPL